MTDEIQTDVHGDCEPESVTGWVDGALRAEEAGRVARHVETCERCREQADEERALRARVKLELPEVELPAELEARIRTHLRRPRRSSIRWTRTLLPLAAAIILAFGWVRSTPSFLAWELANDHLHCFSKRTLPAKIWTNDSAVARGWFEEHGTDVPWLPQEPGRLELIGGRFCPLPGLSSVPHLYYTGQEEGERPDSGEGGRLSVFVVDRPLMMEGSTARIVRGQYVLLRRFGGSTIGIVAADRKDLEAFQRQLDTTVVRLGL